MADAKGVARARTGALARMGDGEAVFSRDTQPAQRVAALRR